MKNRFFVFAITGLLLFTGSLTCMESDEIENEKKLTTVTWDEEWNKKVTILPSNKWISTLRNKKTKMHHFRAASNTLAKILAARVENVLPYKEIEIDTLLAPTDGHEYENGIVLTTILRSGEALLYPFMEFFTKAKVGTVGLERDESTAIAKVYYKKFPKIKVTDIVVILDPMLATGGSAAKAIEMAIEEGAKEENIIFVGVIAAHEGVANLIKKFPKMRNIIIGAVDEHLNEKKYIVPGLGDYGDRYFGTDDYLDK